MYSDPRHLRDHEVKVRLDEATVRLLEALARYQRKQRAVLARDLLLEGLERLLAEEEKHDRATA